MEATPEGDERSNFTGRGKTLAEALDDAAKQAIGFGVDSGTSFEVVRIQVVVSNPQVSEYHAGISKTG
jgi:hypothetical protein